MNRSLFALTAAVAILCAAGPAWAVKRKPAPNCDAAESDDFLTKASGLLLRGATNIAFGWVELFRQPILAKEEGRGPITAIGKGIGRTVLRELQGVGEICLIPAPKQEKTGEYPTLADDCALGAAGLEGR